VTILSDEAKLGLVGLTDVLQRSKLTFWSKFAHSFFKERPFHCNGQNSVQ